MRALIDAYGLAVRQAALAIQLGGKDCPLAVDRLAAEAVARKALQDAILQASDLVAQALPDIEAIAAGAPQLYADDGRHGLGDNFDRPHNARRAFTLKDAKPLARHAAKHLREAWEVLDPPTAPFKT